MNSAKELFGEQRLTDLLVRHRNLGSEGIRDIILARVREFCQGIFEDDLALVCVAIENPTSSGHPHTEE